MVSGDTTPFVHICKLSVDKYGKKHKVCTEGSGYLHVHANIERETVYNLQ